ncbi:GNAT family N-acetyltransferase [Bacillus salitolerans]|uniref:GNAT family N-acetyltransferase n=1 Tax=Bacillus salitolerans TaxID=1437434 RepID=A0ABW4LKX2_9BACI
MYTKQLYVFEDNKPIKATIRNYNSEDFQDLIKIQRESFPLPFPEELLWNTEQLSNHVQLFQAGALCIEVDGVVCGSMTGMLVNFDPENPIHTWEEVTNSGYINNHDPNGNSLYVVDICISPSYRKLGLGKLLMQSMYDVVIHHQLDRLVGGGRLPGYHKHASSLTIEEYVKRVFTGEVYDPVITFLIRCGRTPVAVAPNYLEDEESCHYGLLMEWKNPFHLI